MDPIPPDLTGLMGALIISLVSGFISIAQRIHQGRDANILWVTSEFMSAILCGYLIYDSYPLLTSTYLPEWVSRPVATAVAAHMGGRLFQAVEYVISSRYHQLLGTKDKIKESG